jgi:hypothetical protein
MKQKLRYIFGKILKAAGTTQLVHKLYLRLARNYLNKSGQHVKNAWVRRSMTSVDFTPVVSDIDLTVLINISSIPELMRSRALSPQHLIRDVQIVSEEFLHDWEETGGFRNRQIPAWIPVQGDHKLLTPTTTEKRELAFELAHEVFLLYSQLAIKLIEGEKPAIRKLGLELERLFDYWQSPDSELIFAPREKFFSEDLNSDFVRFLIRQEKFWGELLSRLQPPMGEYDLTLLENDKQSYGSTLFLNIDSRPVFLLNDINKLNDALKSHSAYFIATPNFIRLLKGCGVQEQELLNHVASRIPGYYRKFCRQRLAHDLIGTLLQDPDNQRRLFYCVKNNQEFLRHFSLEAPGWSTLREQPEGNIPWNREEQLDYGLRNLEVLGRVR